MRWKKSSKCASSGACVEVAIGRDRVAVRDSKVVTGPILVFSRAAWTDFVRALRVGGLAY
jgi:hypothetical protein